MSTLASQWPNVCDYRPAWWGIAANRLQNPFPNFIAGGFGPWDPFAVPPFIKPDWWIETFNQQLWYCRIDETSPMELTGSLLPIESGDYRMAATYFDEWGDGPDGMDWWRYWRFRVDFLPTGEYLSCQKDWPVTTDDNTPLLRQQDFWKQTNQFGTSWSNEITDWSIDGWPAPPAPPSGGPSLAIIGSVVGRPADWTPEV